MNVVTVAQRGTAYIVQVGTEAEQGVGRVYDASIRRLHPARPLAELTRSRVVASVVRDGTQVDDDWHDPDRQIDDHEIATAELVESFVQVSSLVGLA